MSDPRVSPEASGQGSMDPTKGQGSMDPTNEGGQEPTAGVQPGAVEVVEDDAPRTAVHEPSKLMRIAIMLREMQEEVRRADPDEAGRARLKEVQERALEQMRSVVSEDLQDELDTLVLPHSDEVPTDSEVRIMQAQLVGWLEGLFQGIQAAVFNQQLQARQQLEQMRQHQLPSGLRGASPEGGRGTGQYL